jgi:hypothetical protein
MQSLSWVFKVRWLLWAAGGLILFLNFVPLMNLPDALTWKFRNRLSWLSSLSKNNASRENFHDLPNRRYFKILFGLCSGFFFLGILGKYSQLWTLNLNAQDFWLFTDILEQSKKGAFFLTRFAPQSIGYVQHGSVHPMLTWGLLTLPAWILGSTWTSLIFNPLVLAAAGWMVGILSRKQWGNLYSLFFSAAFLASTQVGKILNYDVHPESAYPLLIFVWFWSLGLAETTQAGTPRVRWLSLLASTLLCMGTKEDSFLILGPWIVWGLFVFRSNQRRAVAVSGCLALAITIFQSVAVQNWVSGVWGPLNWKGTAVINQASVQAFGGIHWSGLHDIFQIANSLLASQGGFWGAWVKVWKFLFSQPWLSLIILVPWVVGSLQFWWFMLPLVIIHSLIEGPNHLWNYYSASFLGSLWICGISVRVGVQSKTLRFRPQWAVLAALILGSSSIQFFIPSDGVREIRAQVQTLLPCIGNNGLVASHLIGLVPLEKIWTDRIPASVSKGSNIDYVLFSPKLNLFAMSAIESTKLYERLSSAESGFELARNCGGVGQDVVLFVKR